MARLFKHAVVVCLLVLVIGEIWFRLPWTTKILVYEFDEERNYRLVGRQSRGLGLGNFSVMSPRISINSDGFRNTEIDWTAPTILAVGSSQLLGPGLEDDEVWTAIVSDSLSAAEGRPIIVVNAGTPGYGPYHQAVTVQEIPRAVSASAPAGGARRSQRSRYFVETDDRASSTRFAATWRSAAV